MDAGYCTVLEMPCCIDRLRFSLGIFPIRYFKKKKTCALLRSSFFFFAESRLLGRVENSLQFFGHCERTTRRMPPKFRAQVLWSLGYLALNFGGIRRPGCDMRTSILLSVGRVKKPPAKIFFPSEKIAFSFSAIASEPLYECRPNFALRCSGAWGTWR